MMLFWGVCLVSGIWGAIPALSDGFPLEGQPAITSSFGEYRPGRLHMGVDFSTGGRIGLPVRAFGDGTVTRVRCSPWGYGKAVYVKLASGYTIVYGHLSEFREDIRRTVRATQHARRTYTVDLYFHPGEYPVKKGEVIAWSGDTGAGPAHLHVEFRDGAERPVDPRRVGLPWPEDGSSPSIYGVVIYPADPESRVNGTCFPYAAPMEKIVAGRSCAVPVAATGRVYFGAAVLDLTPRGDRLGVWRATVRQGDSRVFEVRMDRLSYDDQPCGALVFDPYSLINDVPVMQLWRRPGNTLDVYAGVAGDGVVSVGDGADPVTLEFEDFGGNVSAVEVQFRRGAGSESPSRWPIAEGIFPMFRGIGIFSRVPGGGDVDARFSAVSDGTTVRLPLTAMGEGIGGWWLPGRSGGAWTCSLIVNGVEQNRIPLVVGSSRESAHLETEDARFVFPAGALPPDTCVWLADGGRPELPGLEVITPCVRLFPEGVPLLKPFSLRMRVPAGTEDSSMAVCRVSGTSVRWLNTWRTGEWLVAESSAAGCFVAAVDRLAPTVNGWQTRQDPERPNRPEILVSVSDQGSGIEAWDLYCGETWLLSSYDPDTDLVVWERDEDLPGSLTNLKLVLIDRAGNRSEWDWQPDAASDRDKANGGK